jgi:ribonuclease HI
MGWRLANFKGKSVWVQVSESGAPIVEGGRVPIRYSKSPGAKVYRGGASRVEVDNASGIEELDAGTAAAKTGGKAKRGSGFGKAGTRTAAQAAMAAEAAHEMLSNLSPETVVAFTDGACKGNPGPAGAGCHLRMPDGRIAESSASLGHATNNVGELFAIGLVFDLLDEADVAPETQVALLSDSSYVNGVLCRGWKAKANLELILGLRERLGGRPGVTIHWIAGHVGIDGNERADELANAGVLGLTASRWL